MSAQSRHPARSNGWQNIKTERGKLLSRYHPIKNILEFKVGEFFYYVDLDEYKEAEVPIVAGDPSPLSPRLLQVSQ